MRKKMIVTAIGLPLLTGTAFLAVSNAPAAGPAYRQRVGRRLLPGSRGDNESRRLLYRLRRTGEDRCYG